MRKKKRVLASVLAIAMMGAMFSGDWAAQDSRASMQPEAVPLNAVIMHFEDEAGMASSRTTLYTRGDGIQGAYEFVTLGDGTKCMKLMYSESSLENMGTYRFMPLFVSPGILTDATPYVCVTYMTNSSGKYELSLYNNGTDKKVILSDDTSVSNGEWVTTAPLDLPAADPGESGLFARLGAKGYHMTCQFTAAEKDLEFYVKEIGFFASKEDAEAYIASGSRNQGGNANPDKGNTGSDVQPTQPSEANVTSEPVQADPVIMNFEGSSGMSSSRTAFYTRGDGIQGSYEFVTLADGSECLELMYSDYSVEGMEAYRFMPLFVSPGILTDATPYVCVTYMTEASGKYQLSLLNNGTMVKINLCDDTSVSNGEWVTTDPINLLTMDPGDSGMLARLGVKGYHVTCQFSAEEEDLGFYVKEIGFFASVEDAEAYIQNQADSTALKKGGTDAEALAEQQGDDEQGQSDSPVSYVKSDLNPETGKKRRGGDILFVFDETNNSLVLDLGSVKEINHVTLHDSDEEARLAADLLELYVSEDDETYTRVESFKLLHNGTDWHLYGFQTQARYVKVHGCHYDSKDASFEGPLQSMIEAEKDTVFLDGGGAFQNKALVSVKNDSESDVWDGIFRVPLAQLGADSSNGYKDIRVLSGEELLYHYVDGEELVARIPYLAAGESVEVSVLSGNPDAMDISNKEGVYEVVYGSKEVWPGRSVTNSRRWITAMPDGTTVGFGSSGGAPYIGFSGDNGGTWTQPQKIEAGVGVVNSDGGMFYGEKSGLLILQGQMNSEGKLSTGVLTSADGGKTWESAGKISYKDGRKTEDTVLSYSNGVELSCYDGDGPNVDFVICVNQMMKSGVCFVSPAYSTDNGKHWYFSDNSVSMEGVLGDFTGGYEIGISEGSIAELSDGRLLLLARFQYDKAYHFARAISEDGGITWTDMRESNVYATNTQAMMEGYDDGILLLWAGNTALGGTSYMRAPLNVALSTDDGENFRSIQDMFSKTSIQKLGSESQWEVTNPAMALDRNNDILLTTFTDLRGKIEGAPQSFAVRVRDFDDFLKRTKGAYDSFEHGSTKYEGWIFATTVIDDMASDGSRSLKLTRGGTAVRSIPYLQNGKVSMQIYAPNGTEKFSVDLQAAYSGLGDNKGTPLALRFQDGKLYGVKADGSDADTGLSLQQGWNELVVDLSLMDGGDASVSLNGSDAVALEVQKEKGDYVCFVSLYSSSVIYVDEFTVNAAANLNAVVEQTNQADDVGQISQNDAVEQTERNAVVGPAPWVIILLVVGIVLVVVLAVALWMTAKKKDSGGDTGQ